MINQMQRTLIKHAKIVNEGAIYEGDILIDGDKIIEVSESISAKPNDNIIDA